MHIADRQTGTATAQTALTAQTEQACHLERLISDMLQSLVNGGAVQLYQRWLLVDFVQLLSPCLYTFPYSAVPCVDQIQNDG